MSKHKICIISGNQAYQNMFLSFGYTLVNDITAADLICFTGGADVDPSYYGQSKHPRTFSDANRDRTEMNLYHAAKKLQKPCVGICRGAQFLNVMNKGQMYQDVTDHCGSHLIHDTFHNEKYQVTSTHHQMMMPSKEAEIIGYSEHLTEREWRDENGEPMKDSVEFGFEIVFYRASRDLCYQPHPEMTLASVMRPRFQGLVNHLLMLNRTTALTVVK